MNLKLSLEQRILAMGRFIADHYFRAKLIFRGEGTRTLHQGEPVIFVSNHSGMNYPWDNLMLHIRIQQFFGASFKFMPLAVPTMFTQRILQLFAVSKFVGIFASPCTSKNFDAVADAGYNILINPEGLNGIAKGFNNKYRLQTYSSSFVRVALEKDREIVPIYVINGEYLNPFAYSLQWLNRIMQKIGVPYLSLGLMTPLYAVFPFAMYISLPARLRYVFGEKINLKNFATKPVEQMSREDLREIAEKVRVIMQADLDKYVQEFGQEKFAMKELFAELRALSFRDALKAMPFSWPFVFHQIDGERTEGLSASAWFACVAMLTPVVGWPLFWGYLLFSSAVEEKTKKHINPARTLDLSKVA